MGQNRDRAHAGQDKVEGERHHTRDATTVASLGQFNATQAGTPILGDTPFQPQADRHAALLSSPCSDAHRSSIVLHLQRSYGNSYVQRLLSSMDIQAKMAVSDPNDIYEREADEVAATVTRAIPSRLQRQPEEEEDESPVRSLLQRASTNTVLKVESETAGRTRTSEDADRLLIPAAIQRDNGEEEGRTTEPRQGTFRIDWDNRSRPWRAGAYNVAVVLRGEGNWSPFGIQITGEGNGIYIREGNDDRVVLQFGATGFERLGVDTGAIAAEFDREGLQSGEVEMGALTVRYESPGRRATITFDVLGRLWGERMQELVERVGSVTSDFRMVFEFPQGEQTVRLAEIGMDLGLGLGPEQLQAVAEMSVATVYPSSGAATTTAEATVRVNVDLWGIEREITVYESEAQAGNIRLFHENEFVQLALRTAFEQTYNDLPGTEGMRPDQAAGYLLQGFNVWYRDAYQTLRRRAIEHYTERGFSNATDIHDSNRTPLGVFAGPRVVMDGRCRQIILQAILPQPDPPGATAVRGIWDSVIEPRLAGRR